MLRWSLRGPHAGTRVKPVVASDALACHSRATSSPLVPRLATSLVESRGAAPSGFATTLQPARAASNLSSSKTIPWPPRAPTAAPPSDDGGALLPAGESSPPARPPRGGFNNRGLSRPAKAGKPIVYSGTAAEHRLDEETGELIPAAPPAPPPATLTSLQRGVMAELKEATSALDVLDHYKANKADYDVIALSSAITRLVSLNESIKPWKRAPLPRRDFEAMTHHTVEALKGALDGIALSKEAALPRGVVPVTLGRFDGAQTDEAGRVTSRTLSLRSLTSSVWSLAKINRAPPQLLDKVSRALTSDAPSVWHSASASESRDAASPSSRSLAALQQLHPIDVVQLTGAYKRANTAAPRLFNALADVTASRVSDFSARDCVAVLESYAALGHVAPHLYAAVAQRLAAATAASEEPLPKKATARQKEAAAANQVSILTAATACHAFAKGLGADATLERRAAKAGGKEAAAAAGAPHAAAAAAGLRALAPSMRARALRHTVPSAHDVETFNPQTLAMTAWAFAAVYSERACVVPPAAAAAPVASPDALLSDGEVVPVVAALANAFARSRTIACATPGQLATMTRALTDVRATLQRRLAAALEAAAKEGDASGSAAASAATLSKLLHVALPLRSFFDAVAAAAVRHLDPLTSGAEFATRAAVARGLAPPSFDLDAALGTTGAVKGRDIERATAAAGALASAAAAGAAPLAVPASVTAEAPAAPAPVRGSALRALRDGSALDDDALAAIDPVAAARKAGKEEVEEDLKLAAELQKLMDAESGDDEEEGAAASSSKSGTAEEEDDLYVSAALAKDSFDAVTAAALAPVTKKAPALVVAGTTSSAIAPPRPAPAPAFKPTEALERAALAAPFTLHDVADIADAFATVGYPHAELFNKLAARVVRAEAPYNALLLEELEARSAGGKGGGAGGAGEEDDEDAFADDDDDEDAAEALAAVTTEGTRLNKLLRAFKAAAGEGLLAASAPAAAAVTAVEDSVRDLSPSDAAALARAFSLVAPRPAAVSVLNALATAYLRESVAGGLGLGFEAYDAFAAQYGLDGGDEELISGKAKLAVPPSAATKGSTASKKGTASASSSGVTPAFDEAPDYSAWRQRGGKEGSGGTPKRPPPRHRLAGDPGLHGAVVLVDHGGDRLVNAADPGLLQPGAATMLAGRTARGTATTWVGRLLGRSKPSHLMGLLEAYGLALPAGTWVTSTTTLEDGEPRRGGAASPAAAAAATAAYAKFALAVGSEGALAYSQSLPAEWRLPGGVLAEPLPAPGAGPRPSYREPLPEGELVKLRQGVKEHTTVPVTHEKLCAAAVKGAKRLVSPPESEGSGGPAAPAWAAFTKQVGLALVKRRADEVPSASLLRLLKLWATRLPLGRVASTASSGGEREDTPKQQHELVAPPYVGLLHEAIARYVKVGGDEGSGDASVAREVRVDGARGPGKWLLEDGEGDEEEERHSGSSSGAAKVQHQPSAAAAAKAARAASRLPVPIALGIGAALEATLVQGGADGLPLAAHVNKRGVAAVLAAAAASQQGQQGLLLATAPVAYHGLLSAPHRAVVAAATGAAGRSSRPLDRQHAAGAALLAAALKACGVPYAGKAKK